MPSDRGIETLAEALERNSVERADKPFILAHGAALTWGDVGRLSAGVADFLLASGAGRGDRVCLLLPRVPELIVAFLGAARIGALPVPVNYTLGADAVRRFVGSTAPVVTVAHEKLLRQHGLDLAGGVAGLLVAVGGEIPGAIPWRRVCAPREGTPAAAAGPDAVAYLNYTTGSTGAPKGAIATHANIYWNTRAAVEAFGFTAQDVHLCMFASFAHPHELFARALHLGGTVALLEEINPKTIARAIREWGVTAMMGLAPMFGMLATHGAGLELPSLRIAESGGMFTRPAIIEGFRRRFGIPVLPVWGSTETTGIALGNTTAACRLDGSIGRPLAHYRVRIVREDGGDAAAGQVGEMLVAGPGVVSGYREPVAFPAEGGWYRTGDLVRRDAEGYHYFVERTSGLLKVAGLKVYPLQVEIALQEHPDVKEAAVVGTEDRLRGVVPKAFVIPAAADAVDAEGLRRFCRARLAEHMVPREIELVAELPRIGSGKVDKRALVRPGGGSGSA